MKILEFDFSFNGPWGTALAGAMQGLARDIAAEPGLLWKLWTENEAEGRAGGIYAFESNAARDAYEAKHRARLEAFGIDEVSIRRYDINEPLSALTRAPLPA